MHYSNSAEKSMQEKEEKKGYKSTVKEQQKLKNLYLFMPSTFHPYWTVH